MISGWCVFQTVCIFCCALARAALLRVSRRGIFSSNIYRTASITVGIFPVVLLFIFQGEIPTPWHFGIILRTLIRSWGFLFQLSLSGVFWRRLQSCRVFLNCFRAIWIFVPYDLLGGLHSCLWVVDLPTARLVALLWDLDRPSVPRFLGVSKVLVRSTLWLREMYWKIISLPYVFVVPWQRRALRSIIIWSPTGLFCSPSSSF